MSNTEQRLLELEAAIEIIADQSGLKNRIKSMLPGKLKEIADREAEKIAKEKEDAEKLAAAEKEAKAKNKKPAKESENQEAA